MIYLDNAATTFPKPKNMLSAMNECIEKYCGNPGRSGHRMSVRTGEGVYQTRKLLAEQFHIDNGERIIFTLNATEALNVAIKGILSSGDHVITTSMEHNSVLRPIKALELEGVTHTIIRANKLGYIDAASIKKEIKQNTKLIVCTHASNLVGTILPIREIGRMARKNGVLFLVDAAQSAGSIEIDVKDMCIDLLALPGHKGLLGPLGTGMLYVRDGIELRHLIQGGTGTFSRELIQPKDFPEGYESGTVNAPGIIGLGRSVQYVNQIGIRRIKAYEDELIGYLDGELRNIQGVQVYGPWEADKKTGIVTFNVKGMGCEEVAEHLDARFNIASRAGYHCAGLAHRTIGTEEIGAVRLSVGPFNNKREMGMTVDAVYRISKY